MRTHLVPTPLMGSVNLATFMRSCASLWTTSSLLERPRVSSTLARCMAHSPLVSWQLRSAGIEFWSGSGSWTCWSCATLQWARRALSLSRCSSLGSNKIIICHKNYSKVWETYGYTDHSTDCYRGRQYRRNLPLVLPGMRLVSVVLVVDMCSTSLINSVLSLMEWVVYIGRKRRVSG
jgi:hypothetical protein